MKRFILSADDFAMHGAIDIAIIDLIRKDRLSATSCLTLSPYWQQASKLIDTEIKSKADIGLHLDFTHFPQSIKKPLPLIIAQSLYRGFSDIAIRRSIEKQLTIFEDALGYGPDYVDGHQHVHQLPQIRELLLEILTNRYQKLPWIRISCPSLQDGFKATLIRILGAEEMRIAARSEGFRISERLLGVYDFTHGGLTFEKKLNRWLAYISKEGGQYKTAFMCHPAAGEMGKRAASHHDDPIFLARVNEYNLLGSNRFLDLINRFGLKIEKGSNFLN